MKIDKSFLDNAGTGEHGVIAKAIIAMVGGRYDACVGSRRTAR